MIPKPFSLKAKKHTEQFIKENTRLFNDKIKEAAMSVLPIVVIVLLVCFSISPIPTGLMLSFLIGAGLIAAGMGIFTLGAEVSMTPIGSHIGSSLTKSRNLLLIVAVSFFLGIAVTIAEPDLQVLAQTVPHIDNAVLIVTVGIGVGFFLATCMLRIIFGWRLRWLLLVFYGIIIALAAFSDKNFLSVAFDSGGVTTGPMTVPFILAFGMGIANIRSDKKAEADNFGLVALCSIGPILAVLVLGFFYKNADISSASESIVVAENTAEIGYAYISAIPTYVKEMALALLPIFAIFLIFQTVVLHIPPRHFMKIILGVFYTYIGLVLFLTGVNVGFSSLGNVLGAEIATGKTRNLLIPLSMALGWFIISAEPAVYVLEQQIESVSSGAISGSAIKMSLSVANAVAMGLSMLRVVTGISIMWFVVPGYIIALLLTFFVPDIYTAIAFDSGGVASGPMTATFMLQFMIGACSAVGGNPLQDAFGVVALVAMMPLITIQVLGLIYSRKAKRETAAAVPVYGDDDIIELWEA